MFFRVLHGGTAVCTKRKGVTAVHQSYYEVQSKSFSHELVGMNSSIETALCRVICRLLARVFSKSGCSALLLFRRERRLTCVQLQPHEK